MTTQKREKRPAHKDFKIRRRLIEKEPRYINTATGKEVSKTEYFRQFQDVHSYPFLYKDLTKGEKLSLKSVQRIRINNKFIKKEAESKIKYHAETKGLKLKNNEATNIDKDTLKKILEKETQAWKNADQTLKIMIERHKQGKAIEVTHKGKKYTGANCIEFFQAYVTHLKTKAEKNGGQVAFMLFKTKNSTK